MAHVKYEKKGKIALIMLNRSDYNFINLEMVAELDDIWRDFQNDNEIWVGILGSASKNFSTGFDIGDFKKIFKDGKFSFAKSAAFGNKGIGPEKHSVTKPIVGAVDGFVNGLGIWLILQADIRIATPHASFGLAEGRLNIPVEFSALMTRYMPRALINEMLFTGRDISAQRFYDLGVINKIVNQEHLMEEANKTAEEICELGPTSVRVMKQLVYYGYEMEYQRLIDLSNDLASPVVNSEDALEGINAFLEKRKPNWKMK